MSLPCSIFERIYFFLVSFAFMVITCTAPAIYKPFPIKTQTPYLVLEAILVAIHFTTLIYVSLSLRSNPQYSYVYLILLTTAELLYLATALVPTGSVDSAIVPSNETIVSLLALLAPHAMFMSFVIPLLVIVALRVCTYPLSDGNRKFGELGHHFLLLHFRVSCLSTQRYPSKSAWLSF
ncbi:hypothetical protein BDP27DRAFT_1312149 [Rhodocollybia butyracea]|uniref:Uncharacterized protein n=1 Tax=Rhodocollybia butyracea TaxID=206335 RepID=A0A9P5UEI5_9AGAR|nr:hypothetical protein BDP27DRAFT_1312149 [Rhodocollybia butyracea]